MLSWLYPLTLGRAPGPTENESTELLPREQGTVELPPTPVVDIEAPTHLGDLDASLPRNFAMIEIPEALRAHVFIRPADDYDTDWYYVTSGRGLGVTNRQAEAFGLTNRSRPQFWAKAKSRANAIALFAECLQNNQCVLTSSI